ncbi:MAG: hypothetical protein QM705_04075 [Ancrocorticia sp.]
MGFFDFLKRNKNISEFPVAAPAAASFPSPTSSQAPGGSQQVPDTVNPALSESPLVAMARIVTGDDHVVVDELKLFLEDEQAFAAAHPAWYERFTDDDWTDSETERQHFAFTRWLISNHEEVLNYGAHMDRKEQPDILLWDLQDVADKLGFPLRLRELPISDDNGLHWEEQLKIVNRYVSEQGYELVPLYDQGEGFYLFLTRKGGFEALYKLGREVGFNFVYSF